MRKQKGITLIALIITIVVLIILAVVAIQAIKEDGLAFKAQMAGKLWEEKQREENMILGQYEDFISGEGGKVSTAGTWVTKSEYITNGTSSLKIGMKVSGYDASKDANGNSTGVEDLGWRILGTKDGKIVLVSVNSIDYNDNTLNYCNGKGYINNNLSVGDIGGGQNVFGFDTVAVSGYAHGTPERTALLNLIFDNQKGNNIYYDDQHWADVGSDGGRDEGFWWQIFYWNSNSSEWTWNDIDSWGTPNMENLVKFVCISVDDTIELTAVK